jgi:hypothetical protein
MPFAARLYVLIPLVFCGGGRYPRLEGGARFSDHVILAIMAGLDLISPHRPLESILMLEFPAHRPDTLSYEHDESHLAEHRQAS